MPGYIHETSLADGKDIRSIEYSRNGVLRAARDGVCLVELSRRFEAIDWEGRILWNREATPGHVVSCGDRLIVSENLERRLVCIDARTGSEIWQFEATPEGAGDDAHRSQVILTGFPSVRVTGSRVVVITMNFRVFVLSLDTGRILNQGRPSSSGCYEVTESSIFFKQPFGLSEFDHREFKEVARIEYEADVAPLYKGRQATVNAFCLTEESVIWTTMHGALMGVSRKPGPDGRRATWCEEIPGALMPLAEAPIPYGDYLYFTKKGSDPELLCFRGSLGNEE